MSLGSPLSTPHHNIDFCTSNVPTHWVGQASCLPIPGLQAGRLHHIGADAHITYAEVNKGDNSPVSRCLPPEGRAGFSPPYGGRRQPPDHDGPIILGAPKGRRNKGPGGRHGCSVAPSGLPGGGVSLIRRLKPPAKSWRPFGTKKRLTFTPFVILSLLACLAFAGCAVNKPYMSARSSLAGVTAADTKQYSDGDVLDGFSHRAQLQFPAKIAVYERTSRDEGYDVRDNESIDTLVGLLHDETRFYQTVVLGPTFIPGDITPANLRRAAAAHRADLTLLCESDFQVQVRPTLLALLDLTVVGAFLVPSQTIEVESRVTAHLLDTRNGLIYHSTLKKRQWTGLIPMAWGRDAVNRHRKELANQNYLDAVKDLRENLQHVERLAAQPTPEPFRAWPPAAYWVPMPIPRPPVPIAPPWLVPDGVRYETQGGE